MTKLCELAYKYKTDKCPKVRHSYTPVYHEMFKDMRTDVKKVLEMGIGFEGTMRHVQKTTGSPYITGASLYMWRDYFPNAQIYGADISRKAMFKANRIETILCDETNPDAVKKLIHRTGSDVDIFIDDGDHTHTVQLALAKTILPLLNKDVIYVIEDVYSPKRILSGLEDYECKIVDLPNKNRYRENLIVVKNK